jgi:hypothetical protein
MAPQEPPLSNFSLLTKFAPGKRVSPTGSRQALAEYKGRPTVIHLYTG